MDRVSKGLLYELILFFGLFISVFGIFAADSPCGGPTDLMSFIDRPSVADSACVAPKKSVILESGYQYFNLLGGSAQNSLPQSLLRYGVADTWEVNIFLPNYVYQNTDPGRGFAPVSLGAKHLISSSSQWVASVDGYLIIPSGSANFGSEGVGGIINGIFSYNISSSINLSGMLGISSQTQSIYAGGYRYSSINPDIVLTWSKEKINVYAEIYGQSNAGTLNGSGFNMDGGILYQVKKNVVLDLELGHRISGTLGVFSHYVGTGISVQFF